MTKALLSVHVLAAIIFIGPVTVAVSLFPRYARYAMGPEESERISALPALRLLHRISTAYAVFGLIVPAFGLATAVQLGVLTDPWLITSIALTAVAVGVLALVVLPGQNRVMARVDPAVETSAAAATRVADPLIITRRLSMASGMFALIWAVVVVLMIVRPGSTTGV